MLARLKTRWEQIITGLWFVPGLMVLAAVVLAWLASSATARIGGEALWWLSSGDASAAADLLSTLLTSMITLATLAISITMVVLTLAAGQLGPRLIRNFMADKRTQLMLGFFLATIVYLVLVLRRVNAGTQGNEPPHLAVTVGIVLVLACVLLLLLFVHHLGRSIVADNVIYRVGRRLDEAIRDMLPRHHEATPAGVRHKPGGESASLSLARGGYVQAINYDHLVAAAQNADAVLELEFRPGHFLLPDGAHGRVHPATAYDDELRKAIADAVVMGEQRTPTQDLEYTIRQLVEVALRALSPGINDPFTAIAVIDRLGLSLCGVMRRGMASGVWCDDQQRVRVTGKTTTFAGLLDAAFNQIRQAGAQPAVLIRLMATFALLAEQCEADEHRRALAEHVDLVLAAGERTIAAAYDLASLKQRARLARERLAASRPAG